MFSYNLETKCKDSFQIYINTHVYENMPVNVIKKMFASLWSIYYNGKN